MSRPSRVEALVRSELLQPSDPRVARFAAAIAAPYGAAARCVLFYGSCLRDSALDGLMLDFYLIVSDYRAAYGTGWYALANRLLPPNVFASQHEGLIAKYAVLSEADFRRRCGPNAGDVSVWARFAQPSRIVWAADQRAAEAAVASVARAAPTLLAYARGVAPSAEPFDLWREGFARTYRCELRAEREDRPGKIVAQDPDRYQAFAEAAFADGLPPLPREPAAAWRRFARRGKRLSVLRLTKALTTFKGGPDYLVWKINRHAGTSIELAPWQRRWPLAGSLVLLPRLLRHGAVR